MAAMTETINIKVLSVLSLITVLMVLNVTIGMQAFVKWAIANEDRQKVNDAVMAIDTQRASERAQLSSLGYSVERDAYQIPIEEAMDLVVQQHAH